MRRSIHQSRTRSRSRPGPTHPNARSRVCSLAWNRHEREILSTHGFSKNQLCLWRYPSLAKAAELTGHTARVLHMAVSPDGTSVVTAAADEGALIVPLRRANHARAAKSKCGAPVDSTGASTGAAGAGATVADWLTVAPVDAGAAALDWASTAATSVMAIGSTMQG